MESPKVATDPGSAADGQALALIILTGRREPGGEWATVNDRLRELATALEIGDVVAAHASLAAARDALAGVDRATTRVIADADAVKSALDSVQRLLRAPVPGTAT